MKEADQHKKKLKGMPNIPNKTTGSTKLPLPISTQLYWKKEVKTKQQKAGPMKASRPPPIYITDIKIYLTTHTVARTNSRTTIFLFC
jgi:hypothetical protein